MRGLRGLRVRKRVGLIAFSLLTFLVSCEILLQLAALATRSGAGDRTGGEGPSDAITILCVGDSHTYGAPLPREDAYPAQLERQLSDRFGVPVRALNRGVPGVNSAWVAKRLAREILQRQPDLVIVWVGTNNRWNSLDAESWEQEGMGERLHRGLLRVRLYRLATVLHMSVFTPERSGRERSRPGQAELAPSDHARGLALDIRRMAETARSLDRPILFVTYPRPTQAVASNVIAGMGAELGVPVIDSRDAYARAVEAGHKPGHLIVMAAGPHPTRLLYGYVVQQMIPEVEKALGRSQ